MPDKAGSRATSIAHHDNITAASNWSPQWETFAYRVAQWRRLRGLSLNEAACALCCTKRTLKRWEAGRCTPRGFTLRAIVAAIEGGAL